MSDLQFHEVTGKITDMESASHKMMGLVPFLQMSSGDKLNNLTVHTSHLELMRKAMVSKKPVRLFIHRSFILGVIVDSGSHILRPRWWIKGFSWLNFTILPFWMYMFIHSQGGIEMATNLVGCIISSAFFLFIGRYCYRLHSSMLQLKQQLKNAKEI